MVWLRETTYMPVMKDRSGSSGHC